MTERLARAIFRVPEAAGGWWRFQAPVDGARAETPDEIPALLAAVQAASRDGLWAVGCLAYEAATAFDAALPTRPAEPGAAGVFGFFSSPEPLRLEPPGSGIASLEQLEPILGEAAHGEAVRRIREAIAAGETYQVNLTFPMTGRLEGDPEALFRQLSPAGGAAYAAYLDLGARAVVSLSPELFFDLDGERLVMRPMKGTRRRGRFLAEDASVAAELGGSAKDRAENLMIVDMARNDLGRIARPGSVRVASLCDLERYPTVWQMTSTVVAETAASLGEILAALFPCASVTGAPKRSAMRFIAALEPAPRGIYCGAIGWMAPAPARRARFSVAIRTAVVERATAAVTYGVGGGIVWDSEPAAEYDECLAKAKALADPGRAVALFETMRWAPRSGIRFVERHLDRLADSAGYWGLPFDRAAALALLRATAAELSPRIHRLRLDLAPDGALRATSAPLEPERRGWRAILAGAPVDSESPLLFHKSVRREPYDRAAAAATAAGADEAILWNERGELTEGSRTNLLLRIAGRWFTPARECGLLAGILRGVLLERGWVREAVLTREDLYGAERLAAVSALRGIIRLELAEQGSPGRAARGVG